MDFQIVSPEDLKSKLENSGHWAKIKAGEYTTFIEKKDPSKKYDHGKSLIISYYDHSQYICTIHRMTDRRRAVKHEHPKRAIIEGVEYRILENLDI